MAEVTLTLLAFLGQDVALVSLGAHDFAGSGDAEALGAATMGFHLGHVIRPFPLRPSWILSSSPTQEAGR